MNHIYSSAMTPRPGERVRNQTNRSIMCNLSISISDGVCVLGTRASQFEFLESCEWIEQIHTRGLFQHLRGIYFSSVCYFVGFNCKSWSFHLWPNVLMIAIWPSSEKLELGFRWDLQACCVWSSFGPPWHGPVLACFVFDPNLVKKNVLIQNFPAILFFCNSWQFRAVSTWAVFRLGPWLGDVTKIVTICSFCNNARGQGSYFVRIRFSVNGEFSVSYSDFLLITDMTRSQCQSLIMSSLPSQLFTSDFLLEE